VFPSVPSSTRGPGRPRVAARDEDFLRAAQDILIEVGYERLSMEAVVERVGASKSTLYRRWPSKAELVGAAVAGYSWDSEPPDTGNLRDDLIALASLWFARDERRDQVFVRVMIAVIDDTHLRSVFHDIAAKPRALVFEAIVRRAADRCEIPTADNLHTLGEVIPAMAFQQLAMNKKPIDREFIVGVIDNFVMPRLMVARKA
jgi:AcrR family transcriptional regulator